METIANDGFIYQLYGIIYMPSRLKGPDLKDIKSLTKDVPVPVNMAPEKKLFILDCLTKAEPTGIMLQRLREECKEKGGFDSPVTLEKLLKEGEKTRPTSVDDRIYDRKFYNHPWGWEDPKTGALRITTDGLKARAILANSLTCIQHNDIFIINQERQGGMTGSVFATHDLNEDERSKLAIKLNNTNLNGVPKVMEQYAIGQWEMHAKPWKMTAGCDPLV